MAGKVNRGKLIVVEGGDRCGKTTQCQYIMKWLCEHGIKSELLKFPDRSTPIGVIIDQYLRDGSKKLPDQAIHLLFSANRWELKERIDALLSAGVSVLCDRYAYSGIAYSAAKGLEIDWCRQPDIGLAEPDAVIFLDADPELVATRADYGAERYERVDFQKKIRQVFTELKGDNWYMIDAVQSPEAVSAQISAVLQKLV